MPEHWLLVRGRGERPLERRVDPDGIRAHSSTKRPSVQRGDMGVLYAAVWQAVFAVVEVIGDPEQDPTRTRWSWRFPIRASAVVTDLEEAPPVEAAGVFPQSIWRHSHIRLTREQFESARALIEAAAYELGGSSSARTTARTGSSRSRTSSGS
ncbi:MAG TPA: hypothetical protein VE615_07175 [Gaiellaceae bacterium]|nr:hypothetical protein [Gaiellaceae bacterium]